MPKAIKAGPSNQKIPASGTETGVIAFASVGIQMIPKSIHTQVVIFAPFFFKFQTPNQIVVDNTQQ